MELIRADCIYMHLYVIASVCICVFTRIPSQGWTAVMSRAMRPCTGRWRATRKRAAGLFWTWGPTPTYSTLPSCPRCTWLSASGTTTWWRWGRLKCPAEKKLFKRSAPVFLCFCHLYRGHCRGTKRTGRHTYSITGGGCNLYFCWGGVKYFRKQKVFCCVLIQHFSNAFHIYYLWALFY